MARLVAIIALLGAAHASNLQPQTSPAFRHQRALLSGLNLHQKVKTEDKGKAKIIPENFAHKGCMADGPDRKLQEKSVFDSRDSMLKYAQPWKYKAETLRNYQEDPKIKKVYYIHGYDENREKFMEDGLNWVKDKIPHEKFMSVTRDQVDGMPVNGGVPQDVWSFSSAGMAPYLKAMDRSDVLGTVGVYLSHAKLFEKIKNEDGNSTDLYAIMEDDTALDPSWDVNLLEAVKALPPDWDIARFVYWGGQRCQDAVPFMKANQSKTLWYEALGPDKLSEVPMYVGNQAYLIRPKSIEHILATLRDLPVMDIDGALGSNHKLYEHQVDGQKDPLTINWGLYTYAIGSPLGRHTDLGSQRVSGGIPGVVMNPWGEGQRNNNPNPFFPAFR